MTEHLPTRLSDTTWSVTIYGTTHTFAAESYDRAKFEASKIWATEARRRARARMLTPQTFAAMAVDEE